MAIPNKEILYMEFPNMERSFRDHPEMIHMLQLWLHRWHMEEVGCLLKQQVEVEEVIGILELTLKNYGTALVPNIFLTTYLYKEEFLCK